MTAILAAAALFGPMGPARGDIADRPEVAAFMQEASAAGLEPAALASLFQRVELRRQIIDAMDHPAESKPWKDYRKNMVDEAHIKGGVDFWKRNRAALEEASGRYGVPQEMIVAILGMESRYGEVLGGFRVIDSLSTLAFGYPRRADFFRKELKEYLLLCKEEKIDPILPKGSYAGAMGMPQFLPSSYRQYATDMDGDHHRNIWSNPPDAIASVANYLARSGWRPGEPVAVEARVSGDGDGMHDLLDRAGKPGLAVGELRKLGVEALTPLPDSARARTLVLENEAGPEYWLALQNFDVIQRYNQSLPYAMAAYQLGRAILARKGS